MGQIANILDFRIGQRGKALSSVLPAPVPDQSDFARLIPGVAASKRFDENAKDAFLIRPAPRSRAADVLSAYLPRICERLHGQMLLPVMLDVSLIALVSVIEKCLFSSLVPALSLSRLCVFIAIFLAISLEEELYSQTRPGLTLQAATMRTVFLASIFAWLYLAHEPGTGRSLLVLSFGSLVALGGMRWLKEVICTTTESPRNVLIIGNGRMAQQVADAIQRHQVSRRVVKAFMAENHLRNVYGPSMLSRIARESFIDELIVASTDPEVAKTAIQEARRNALDVRIAPQICISSLDQKLELENAGGTILLKVCQHRLPNVALNVKRSLDAVIALSGLIALSPAFLIIAALIKLDSRGPALYRAPRIGSKGREFHCYKFRTMVPDADESKANLRANNERRGAFFKIANDPRVTRVGRFLRRYSLDELPQLWNVLRGEMSLVGPRPHPPDDVSFYEARDLQRLDAVPGMTGLWQVTARRDPCFERSVALDVEYIKNWSLWLDARILWRTIFVVLEGSGA
ncbi:MAG TPA: sugar transferase [Terriglobales bacterium]|nr:sugar transferase [Terriglobales bacterium]